MGRFKIFFRPVIAKKWELEGCVGKNSCLSEVPAWAQGFLPFCSSQCGEETKKPSLWRSWGSSWHEKLPQAHAVSKGLALRWDWVSARSEQGGYSPPLSS